MERIRHLLKSINMQYTPNIERDAKDLIEVMRSGVKDENYELRRDQPIEYKQAVSNKIIELTNTTDNA